MADLAHVRGCGDEGRLTAERPFCIGRIAWHTTRLELYWCPKQGPLAAAMKVRKLIEGASFDPQQLKTSGKRLMTRGIRSRLL